MMTRAYRRSSLAPLAAACALLALACSSVPRPAKLSAVDKLMADSRAQADVHKVAPDLLKEAQRYHELAVEAYEDNELDRAEDYAVLAELTFKTGLERAKIAAASQRIAQAEDRREEAAGESAEQKAKLAELKPLLERMEKLLKMGSAQAQLQQELEKQRREEKERLERERKQAEVQNKLALVSGKLDTATALKAEKVDKANVDEAKSQLTQARNLAEKAPDKALTMLNKADQAITAALEKARKAMAEENAKLDMLKQQKEILARASSIPGVEAVQMTNSVVMRLRQLFRAGQTRILDEQADLLRQVAELLKAYDRYPVLVQGYTDSRGAEHKNLALSSARAEAVQSFLVQAGVAPSRLKSAGYGEAKPVDDNSTREGRARNRRVEVVILFP